MTSRQSVSSDDVVSAEVEAIVPELLWTRVQEVLVGRRENRLPPQRYAGGYVLTDLLRCTCGAGMAGTSNRNHRYCRCKARCGRPHVRAGQLEAGVFDEQPVTVTPKLVQQTIDEMNGILEHAALDTRVAWVRDLFDRIDVDSRAGEATAVWRTGGDEIGGVSRSNVVSEWLRR